MLARYHSSSLARFLSVDPGSDFVLTIPQSWNSYAYVRNNPVRAIDPNGETLADFMQVADGMARGAIASLSFGTAPGSSPSAGDSGMNRVGQALGSLVVGVLGAAASVGGTGGVVLAGAVDDSGALGAPGAMLAAAGGIAVVGAGNNLSKMTEGISTPKAGSSGGPGAGKDFSKRTKDAEKAANAAGNSGRTTCVYCGDKTTSTPGPKQTNIDHAIPKAKGGNNAAGNAQVTCRTCNLKKGAANSPPE